MTADVDLARLLGAVERAGALIVVRDDHQLDAIGPGGALTALTHRHPDRVWTLSDNLRQTDPGEQAALTELRAGDPAAVAWYLDHDRVHPAHSRARTVQAIVGAWASDTAGGADTLMMAYRRDNVDALNTAARQMYERAGLLSGPELTAPGGRQYRAGDRVVTLAPAPRGAWVTSQPAQVTAINPTTQQLTAVTLDGQRLNMTGEDLGADRLAHGYAVTAHRAQVATVDIAHVLEDGGGRELAHVAMSRARHASHVYLTAADELQAGPRLARAWDQQRRQQWVSDQTDRAASKTDLLAERDRLVASIPPDVTQELDRLRQEAARIDADIADLHTGTGPWTTDPTVASARRHSRPPVETNSTPQPSPPPIAISGCSPAAEPATPNTTPPPRSPKPTPPGSTPCRSRRDVRKMGMEPDRGLGIHINVRDRAASPSTGFALPFAEVDFSAFYHREYPCVVRLAWMLVRSSAVAEDLAQEAFIALARQYEQVDNPAGFVHRVVVNQARTWHRNERRNAVKVRRAGTDVVAALPPGDAELFDLVGVLPYRQRAVVVLRYWHGWSETEIADVLGCRPGTVKSLASRALRRLREEIQHDLTD